jgi:hypothetical protein
MLQLVRALMVVFTLIGLTACSGGSDNIPQSGAPPGSGESPGPPVAAAQPGRFNGEVTAMIYVPDSSGDVYVAGNFTTYNGQPVGRVVRLKPDGTLDGRFHVTSIMGSGVTALALADNGTGDLYISEQFVNDVSSLIDRAQISKLHPNGEPDPSFAVGHVTRPSGGTIPLPLLITAMNTAGDGTGRVYIGGLFSQYNSVPVNHLVRVNPDGTLDRSFLPNALGVYRMVLANDGSGDLYTLTYGQIGPSRLGSKSVERFNPDGTPDAAFTRPGIDGSNFSRIWTIAHVDDGSGDLFVSGSFTFFGGQGPLLGPELVRINADGTVDETSPRPNAGNAQVLTKAPDGSGDWFANPSIVDLQRFEADGPVVPSFAQGTTGEPGGINILLPTADETGDLYVAGNFTTYNGVSVGNIVRINGDGTLH